MAEQALPIRRQRALAIVFLLIACSSVSTTPRPKEMTTSVDEGTLARSTLSFATAASAVMNDHAATPPPNNTYSYETEYEPGHLAEPPVSLLSNGEYSAIASTDCSGWVSFVVNTVSPLHEAVLQSQRRLHEYNEVYFDGFELDEGERPWSRAFVLTNYFRTDYAGATGFEPIHNFEELAPGDIAAYALGRYTDPSDASLGKPKDTGHTFVVTGSPSIVDPSTPNYDANGTLSERAVAVFAVAVVDSSSALHFDPDSRQNARGQYTLPPTMPEPSAKAGGIGTGTIWFALDGSGRVLQRRIGPHDEYGDIVFGAVRLRNVISLAPEVLDSQGKLVVEVFESSPSVLGGISYGPGATPIALTGLGGIRLVGGGRLILSGRSSFAGGVTVESGELLVGSETALGTGDVELRGGSLTLKRAAIADQASLRLSDSLEAGAVHLGFPGGDIVHSLQLGDVVHRCGTWGGPDSGAMFTDPHFSGPGTLELAGESMEACVNEQR
ncbi:MAG: hypothetical protein WBN70_00895 [Polyangiales bacterium]